MNVKLNTIYILLIVIFIVYIHFLLLYSEIQLLYCSQGIIHFLQTDTPKMAFGFVLKWLYTC